MFLYLAQSTFNLYIMISVSVQTLCSYVKEMPYDGLKIGALNVLTTLSGSVAVFQFHLEKGIVYSKTRDLLTVFLLIHSFMLYLFVHIFLL